ncbi:hypothetical protein M0R04_04755 [Candidatus Dojkabacteria bacterium]|jgi:hypothetical protein|nr:hypothetical protein [Candidatus Dojkabacteria bacterium]
MKHNEIRVYSEGIGGYRIVYIDSIFELYKIKPNGEEIYHDLYDFFDDAVNEGERLK